MPPAPIRLLPLTLLLCLLAASAAEAQRRTERQAPPPAPEEDERGRWTPADTANWPEWGRDTAGWYTVRGERHGASFFRRHRHPEVEYVAGARLAFDRYHTVDVMYAWLQRWAQQYPNLVELYEVGRSFEGRPILQVTLTNQRTGSHLEKPAAFFEGGRHSGEITGSESVLWLMQHLLQSYGRDQRITRLLDTKTIYLRPQNNPDGSNMYLHTAQRNRSSVRPHDTDRDGLVDEDPEEDLDGDGVIHTLRWRARPAEDGRGAICYEAPRTTGEPRIMRANATLDPRDATGRLMRAALEEVADWCIATEGIDNDGDARFNEDGIGGLDLHRNYVENWRPEPGQERTGRGQTQFGAGEYPLSEPETRTVVMWLLQHPHVSVANSMDTRVPMHLRPPSTSASEERMFPEDLRYYEHFDSVGLRITRYPWAGDVYETYATRYEVNPVTGDPNRPSPLFGHGPDFGYWYFGSIWYGDELWNGGMYEDYNNDGVLDDVDALTWDDRHNGGRGFRAWTPLQHPQLGAVEIGGFHPKFFAQNGPPEVLEEWARNQALFNLEMALALPQLELEGVDVRQLATTADSATYAVTVRWRNSGQLPTALRQAQLVKIVEEDRAQLEFAAELTRGTTPRVRIVTPATRDKTVRAGWTEPGESKEVTFEVRTYGAEPVEGTVNVLSTRGGLLKAPLRLAHEGRRRR
ncbi:MAG: M14 family metallopeptidase [Longimicrobiaceae bacterium]